MAIIIQKRRDPAATWTAENPILADGEEGYESDTRKSKVGDGVTAWNALPYISTGGSGTPEEIRDALETLTDGNRLDASAIQGLPASYFKGTYTSLAALETAHPTGDPGDEALVDPGVGTDAVKYIWDESDGAWVEGGGSGASTFADLTGSPNDNAALDAALDAKQDSLGYTAENQGNKATSLASPDNTKYPTTQAVSTALAAKQDSIGFTPENVSNKSSNLTSPDNTKYPTTQAVATGLATKQNTIGYTPENTANKATDLSSPDNTKYPTTQAVANAIASVSIPGKATQSDVDTGTDDTKYITSLTNRGNQEKFRAVTANFTVDSADRGGTILTTSATDITGTINQVTPGLSTLLPQAQIIARGAGNVNLVAGSGVSLIVAGVVSSSAFIEAGGGALLSWESVTVVRVTTGSAAQWAQIALKPTTMLGYAITDGWRNLFQTFTPVGTPNSTTETDLLSQDMGSNKLLFDGERIVVEAAGTFAATPSNSKRLRVLLGATLITDTTAVLLGGIQWTARITVMRTGATSQRVWAVINYGTAVATGYAELTGSDLSTAVLLTIKGTGVATADVTLQMASGDKTGKA